MKYDVTVIDPEWKIIPVEEEAREILVQNFKATSMVEAAKVVVIIAELATEQGLHNQVSCSVDTDRIAVILHTGEDTGGIPEPLFRLARDIDSKLAPSPQLKSQQW